MTKKVLLIAGLLIILGGSAYLLFSKRKDGESSTSGGENAPSESENPAISVKSNLGSQAVIDSKGNVGVSFNDKKNYAWFYPNNRFSIFSGTKLLLKGSYSNGGKKLVIDGGKTIESGSVWNNLSNAIKK